MYVENCWHMLKLIGPVGHAILVPLCATGLQTEAGQPGGIQGGGSASGLPRSIERRTATRWLVWLLMFWCCPHVAVVVLVFRCGPFRGHGKYFSSDNYLWVVVGFYVGNEARTAGKGQERVSIPGGGKNQAGRGSFLPVDSVSKFETTMSWKHLFKHV